MATANIMEDIGNGTAIPGLMDETSLDAVPEDLLGFNLTYCMTMDRKAILSDAVITL